MQDRSDSRILKKICVLVLPSRIGYCQKVKLIKQNHGSSAQCNCYKSHKIHKHTG